jgi:hypothetical protein
MYATGTTTEDTDLTTTMIWTSNPDFLRGLRRAWTVKFTIPTEPRDTLSSIRFARRQVLAVPATCMSSVPCGRRALLFGTMRSDSTLEAKGV